MLHLLLLAQQKLPFPFSLIAVSLDQGFPNFPADSLRSYFERLGVEHHMIHQDTRSIVLEKVPEGKSLCSLCSRLRRGILYRTAVELRCTKVALGHHRDDAIETLLLNLFYSGQLKSMSPRLRSDDGRNVVIRPLIFCRESEIIELVAEQSFPIVPPSLCSAQSGIHRQEVKELIDALHAKNPKVRGNMFAALRNVCPSHLLDMALREQAGLDPQTSEQLLK